MVLTWLKWSSALVLAGVLAIPITTLVLSVFYFPIFVFAAIGIFANIAPLLLLAAAGLRRLGITVGTGHLLGIWQFFGTVWIGCAYRLSRWGDVGSVFGGQSTPYLEMLFAPWFICSDSLPPETVRCSRPPDPATVLLRSPRRSVLPKEESR